MHEFSGYVDVTLYRGSGTGLSPILLVAAEETSFGCVERLEHEYALKCELDPGWAARPMSLTHYKDRLTLVLEDPGGAPLDQLLGRPLDISHCLRIAIPLAAALRRVHERGLIHKDINVWRRLMRALPVTSRSSTVPTVRGKRYRKPRSPGSTRRLRTLRQEIQRLNALNSEMMQTEDKQISLTDPDARSMLRDVWLVQAVERYAQTPWLAPNNVAVLAEMTISHKQCNLVRN